MRSNMSGRAKGSASIVEFDALLGDMRSGGKKWSDQIKGILHARSLLRCDRRCSWDAGAWREYRRKAGQGSGGSREEIMGVAPLTVLETERLLLRQLSAEDADFILELLNEPSFIRNIGDRGVRTIDGAISYILNGPVASYAKNGFGLYLVN